VKGRFSDADGLFSFPSGVCDTPTERKRTKKKRAKGSPWLSSFCSARKTSQTTIIGAALQKRSKRMKVSVSFGEGVCRYAEKKKHPLFNSF